MVLHKNLKECDPEIYQLIKLEENRQKESIDLIASENYAPVSVLQANASVLTNKYSEGRVGCRYYGGTENIDSIEKLCKERALKLFKLDPNVWGVNVQVLSGSIANFAVYTALAGKDGKIMGLDLPSGGHLTHGYQTPKRKVSATSLFFNSKQYKCESNGLINYDKLRKDVEEFDPKILIIGGTAYVREFDYKLLRDIAGERYLMMDMAHISGFIASGLMEDPFKYCDVVTTTTHKILRGPRSGMIFYKRKSINGVNIEALIEAAVFPGLLGGPHNQKIGALAIAIKQADSYEYREYAAQTLKNAQVLANELKKLGYKILTDGTDCHIVMICLEDDVRASEVERLCELVNISVNKNCIVGDTSPLNPTGIRLGTPAVTSRGFKENDIITTVNFLHNAISLTKKFSKLSKNSNGIINIDLFNKLINENEEVIALRKNVINFASKFKIPHFEL